jgi:hypothetical protein
MKKFSEILSGLENTDHLNKIELRYPDGTIGTIENIPGSQGSVKVYHHLIKKYGAITPEAAKDGLAIYAEHTADAEQNPGKHPNIDRLFTVISSGKNLSATIY